MYTAGVLLNILLLVILMWLGLLFQTLLHELGHALMYSIIFRNVDWHIRIGMGRPIMQTKKFTIKIFVLTGFFMGSFPQKPSKMQSIMIFFGGSFVDVIFIIVLRILMQLIGVDGLTLGKETLVWFLSFLYYASMFSMIASLIPMKISNGYINNYISDGMRILMKLREANGN